MSRKSKERKLTRLILAALVSAGGGMLSAPSVASADVTVTSETALGTTPGLSITLVSSFYYIHPVSDNVLNITGGSYTPAQYFSAGYSTSANISGYTLNVSGGTIEGYVNGGYSVINGIGGVMEGTADGNTVNISGGEITEAYGGIAGGNASNNTVTVTEGTVDEVCGGRAVFGNATGNTVNISGGKVYQVEGGHTTNISMNGSANGNTVNITGGDIMYDVYGGVVENGRLGDGADSNVMNNTVNILAQVSIGRHLYGGYGTLPTGNTLNVAAKGITVGGNLGYFQNLNFYLPTDTAAGDTMLTVAGTANVEGATFGVAAQEGLASLSKDDTVTLLKAATLEADDTLSAAPLATVTASAPTGIVTSAEYEFEIAKSGTDAIIATVTKAKEVTEEAAETARELSKSPAETRAATTTFVNAGADLLASQGFSQAANAVALDMAAGEKGAGGFTPFAAFGGQGLRAQSGSYVDTKGFGLNIGFAREIENAQGKLLFGPVVEYGGGSYTSHLEDDAGTRGDGKAHYFGVGVMARQVNTGGFYYEGSVRGGRVTSDYESFLNNQKADYDSASNYWAAHVGVGKAMRVGGSNTLDGYLKYFYSHQAGDDVTIHGSKTGDEEWSFDSVDSHRIRLGARLTHKVNDMNSFYGGFAYQYEFGGEARAHYNGTATPSPSVKGSSGMLELGWQVKPGGPVTLDLGFTGWAGKQRGGSVQLGATWTF